MAKAAVPMKSGGPNWGQLPILSRHRLADGLLIHTDQDDLC